MKTHPFATRLAAGLIAALVPCAALHAAGSMGRTSTTKLASAVTPTGTVGADLAVSITASEWDPEDSSELVYTVTVSNLSKSAGSAASLTSPLSGFVAWTGGDDACQPVGDEVICTVEPIAGGDSRQLWFVLEVLAPYPTETIQEVRLTAQDPDPIPLNDSARVRTALDDEPPVVDMVRALFADSARRLRSCTQLSSAPIGLEVTFSEPMQAGSISRFVDVTSSYRLVRPGANGTFEEPTCSVARDGGLPSDDVDQKILDVEWDEENLTAQLELAPVEGAFGSSGHYRLIACDSLTDLAGNPIDGDGDGQGGDAAVVDFRVDEGNLIDNGHFDCSLDHWISVGSEPDAFGLGDDAEQSPLSRSARIESASENHTVGAGQCIVEPAPGTYELSVLHRVSPASDAREFGPVTNARVGVACTYYESTTCDGMTQLVGAEVSASVPDPGDGTWGKLITALEVPATAGSLLCTVAASSEGESLDFGFDQVRLVPAPLTAK